MTRQDFELIARALATSRPRANEAEENAVTCGRIVQWQETVAAFSRELASANPGFKPDRFERACEEAT